MSNPITRFISKFVPGKTKVLTLEDVGWHPTGGSHTYSYYKENNFENAYGSIMAIANRGLTVEPYGIDAKGKEKEDVPAINALYHPNKDMSAVDFREALYVMYLVHPVVHIRVHGRGGNKPSRGGANIVGYTFLEEVTELRGADGILTGYLANGGEQVGLDEVIRISGFNPYDISLGYSPSKAARRWTRLDDYIADYEAGFFENNAVPAGQMIITAPTRTEYRDMKKALQNKHQGAGKNNNIVYTYRPVDPESGQATNAQIEWVPFSSTNKEMNLDALFSQVNKKIDSVYAVPASIRAVNDQNTYASVKSDEVIFIDQTVRPITLKLWSKFTHELNRITGGIDAAITFDLDTPRIAEEEKTDAERKGLDMGIINKMLSLGWTLKSIVEAFDLDPKYLDLKKDPNFVAPVAATAVTTPDNPNVTTDDEVEETPAGEQKSVSKQVSARQIANLYSDLVIDSTMVQNPDTRGCIMLKTEVLDVISLVSDAAADLAESVTMDRSPVPGETSPHVTLLYGLLNNGNIWKGAVDSVLNGWEAGNVVVDSIGFFELPDSRAIVAHIKPTTELVEGHDRLRLLPNAETFSEYKPHMTLAYIKKDADLGKWISALGEAYNGRELYTAGIDYGDLPEEGEAKSTNPKALESKQITDGDRRTQEQQVQEVVKAQLSRQVEVAIQTLDEQVSTKSAKKRKAYGDSTESQDEQFAEELLQIMTRIITIYGIIEVGVGTKMLIDADLPVDKVKPFYVAPAQRNEYREYLKKIARYFDEQTADMIREVLASGLERGATRAEIESGLRDLINGGYADYRATRLAVTEVNTAGSRASVLSMQNIQADTGYKIVKIWTHFGADPPCEYCASLIGQRINVDGDFVPEGDEVHGIDGGVMVNRWRNVDSGDIHANGHCGQVFEVVRP